MKRMRLIARDDKYGLWFPHLQQWWELSDEAADYLQGKELPKNSIDEIEGELRTRGLLEDIRNSPSYPINTVQFAPEWKPPTVAIIHTIWNCNLDCPDCYIKNAEGWGEGPKLEKESIITFLQSFAEAGGLFADISGGEPLLRKDIYEILQTSYNLGLRTCLVTNGTLLTKEVVSEICSYVDQVTISIDGDDVGHDEVRGSNSYSHSMNALALCSEQGISTAATTTLRDISFAELKRILHSLSRIGVTQWNLTALRRPWNGVEEISQKKRPLSSSELQNLGTIANQLNIEIVADEAIIDSAERTKILNIEVEREEQRWHSTLTVMPDGGVVPCVFHPKRYANIREMSASQIAVSNERKKLLANVYNDMCNRCLN